MTLECSGGCTPIIPQLVSGHPSFPLQRKKEGKKAPGAQSKAIDGSRWTCTVLIEVLARR